MAARSNPTVGRVSRYPKAAPAVAASLVAAFSAPFVAESAASAVPQQAQVNNCFADAEVPIQYINLFRAEAIEFASEIFGCTNVVDYATMSIDAMRERGALNSGDYYEYYGSARGASFVTSFSYDIDTICFPDNWKNRTRFDTNYRGVIATARETTNPVYKNCRF